MTHADIWDSMSTRHTEGDAKAVNLHTDNREIAQVSILPGGDGFLIRVWGADQTHEHGGGNLNAFSATIRFEGTEAKLEDLSHRQAWGARVKAED